MIQKVKVNISPSADTICGCNCGCPGCRAVQIRRIERRVQEFGDSLEAWRAQAATESREALPTFQREPVVRPGRLHRPSPSYKMMR